jgi:hypothetical protein
MRTPISFLLIALMLAGGCATTDATVAGSKPWYEQRIGEIESAHARGDLSTEEYIRLKTEADAVRATYRGTRGPRSSVSVGVGFFSHD